MNNNNKNCIVCGEYSNGKPQCRNCWNISKKYSDNLFNDYSIDITSDKTLNSLFYKKLKSIKKEKNYTAKQKLCNELIGIGLTHIFSEELTNSAYEEITKLLKVPDLYNKNLQLNEDNDFRKQFPADLHCQDGHYVRSKDERTIDDYLYNEAKLLHAYEPKFRLSEEEKNICKNAGYEYDYFYPDFYIPQFNLYLEFFGKDDEKYNQKMGLKIKILSHRKDINFRYLTYKDGNLLIEKLQDILEEFH